eukprot:1392211-Alexandrium_andersonii.AAC.1
MGVLSGIQNPVDTELRNNRLTLGLRGRPILKDKEPARTQPVQKGCVAQAALGTGDGLHLHVRVC